MKSFYLTILIFCSIFLSSCSILDVPVKAYDVAKEFVFPSGEKLRWDKVSIGVSQQANKNSPVAVDIVMIFDESLVPKIFQIPAGEWFNSKKSMFINTFPKEISVKSWELAPGDLLQVPSSFFGEERIFAVVAFADYFSDGDHRIRIDELAGGVVLEFGVDDFSAYSIGKK